MAQRVRARELSPRVAHKRIYTLFLDGDNLVDARYAVQTDPSGTQAYGPFENCRRCTRVAAEGRPRRNVAS